jgi:hypothetical protein
MASLTGQTISSTYDSLLKVTDNGPLNSSLKTITDGLGNSSSLQLSTVAAYITGGLTVTGQLTLPGAFDLTVNGFTIGKGPGALNNTVYGFQSLLSNTTGVFNTANGYQSLYNNTIGEYNTSFGLQSMFSNVAGGNNVGIGANSLPSNTSGNNNTAIGRYAGFGTGTNNNITGSNNIFIGYQSVGISSSESNRTWIGNSSTLATWVGGNLLIGATTNNGFGLEVTGTSKISGQLTLGSTITNGTYTYTLPSATGTIALVGGAGVGTVTSVAAITLGTSGTDLSSTVANGTTTPVITLNVPTASASNRGVLSSTDWSTFNSKQGTITLTTTGTSGAATFVSNTLNIPNYADGGVLSLSAIGSTPNANAGTITGTVLNLEPASASFGGVVTTGTQTFAGDKTLTGTLYGIGLSMTGTSGDIIGSVATSGKAIRGTATTGFGVYSSATTGTAIYGESTGTGGAGINGTAGNGIGGYFLNNATGFATLYVTNNGSGNLANFSNSAGTKFTINNAGNLGNGTYTYTLPSATGTLALTSALSGYLPLTGGTLTGALSGTSATFSGNGAFNTTSAVSGYSLDVRSATNKRFGIVNSNSLSGAGVTFYTDANAFADGYIDATKLLLQSQSGGNVGIGNASPTAKLQITSTSAGAASVALFLNNNSATSSTETRIAFAANTNDDISSNRYSYISALNTSGSNGQALIFATNETGNAAVERMRITSGGNVGIGTTSNLSSKLVVNGSFSVGNGWGVSGATLDIFPDATGSNGVTLAASYWSGSYGPLIFNTSATTRLTIASGGAVTIVGSLSKGSGSFRIEHPLPSLSETHQLVHSFIEGPQADLIYRGKLTLVNGKAQANIDEVSTMTEGTFEVLCREVQCFTTNESGWDLIKGKVIGNIIYIESQNENSTDEISWMVIGERKDKHMMETEWTDENGKVIVEPLKPIEQEPMEDLTEVSEPIVPEVTPEPEPIVSTDNNLE